MVRSFRLALPFALVVGVSTWIAWTATDPADWSLAGMPAVHALAHGEIGKSLSANTLVGPFAILVEAPFTTVAGESVLSEYRWASLPCLFAVGILGLYLASLARQRGASLLTQVLISALCLVNPLTVEALENGHPEELLTAALAVGAIATASQGHPRRTAVLLGLAIASKQWALVAVLPVLMALPNQRLKVGVGAAAIAAVCILPRFAASPENFTTAQTAAAHTTSTVSPLSVWYPLATETTERYQVGTTELVANLHKAPSFARNFAHSLVVLLSFGLPVLLALRRRAWGLTGADAMALLAFLMLLRCALDPVDNIYYHLPFLLALIGWDALSAKGLPVRAITGAGLFLLLWHWSHHLENVAVFSFVYIATTVAACLLIAFSLFKPRWWTRVRSQLGPSRRLSYGSTTN